MKYSHKKNPKYFFLKKKKKKEFNLAFRHVEKIMFCLTMMTAKIEKENIRSCFNT